MIKKKARERGRTQVDEDLDLRSFTGGDTYSINP